MTGFTLFGMAVLVIMSAAMMNERKCDSAMPYTDESVTTTENKKAA
ncbi:hypothetical protein [Nitrospira sp. Nam74]